MDRPSVLGFQVDSVLWLPVQPSRLPVPPFLPPRGFVRMMVGYRLGIDWITIGARLEQQKSVTESRPNIDQNLTLSRARRKGDVQRGNDGGLSRSSRAECRCFHHFGVGNHTVLGVNGREMNGKPIEIDNKVGQIVRGIGIFCKFAVHFPSTED